MALALLKRIERAAIQPLKPQTEGDKQAATVDPPATNEPEGKLQTALEQAHSVPVARHSDGPLFIDNNGNPLRCTKCKYARTKYVPEVEREHPYVWHGLCLLDPNELLNIVGMNSRCALITGEDYASIMQ